jgi:hypothetical protein
MSRQLLDQHVRWAGSRSAWRRPAAGSAPTVSSARVDAAKEKLTCSRVSGVDLIAFPLPMHTATRLAGAVIAAVAARQPGRAHSPFGLSTPLNEQWLRSLGVDDVFGGEFEEGPHVLARE